MLALQRVRNSKGRMKCYECEKLIVSRVSVVSTLLCTYMRTVWRCVYMKRRISLKKSKTNRIDKYNNDTKLCINVHELTYIQFQPVCKYQ